MDRLVHSCYGWCFQWMNASYLVRRYRSSANRRPRSEQQQQQKARTTPTYLQQTNDADDDADSSESENEHRDTIHYFKKASARNNDNNDCADVLQQRHSFSSYSSNRPHIVISGTTPGVEESPLSAGRTPCDGCETPISTHSSPLIPMDKLLGKLLISAQYTPMKQRLEVTVREGYSLQLMDSDALSQVRVLLLPDKKEKQKSRFVEGQNPKYEETFIFTAIEQESLPKKCVRLRVYRKRHAGRHQLLGETTLRLCLIDGRGQTRTSHLLNLACKPDSNLNLSPSDLNCSTAGSRRGSMVDDAGRFCSSPTGNRTPELLLSLCYDDHTGKMVVGLEKGSCFGIHSKLPDTFIKVTVLSPYGDEIGKQKTDVIKDTSDPIFDISFVFQIPYSELRYTSVLLQVYSFLGVWRRRVLIGWLSLGQNCTSTVEEEHWEDMIQGMGTPVSKWHVLIEP